MHAYREFVQRQMDSRGWTQAELARASGLSPAVISRILTDDRDRLVQLPEDSTIAALARGFAGPDMEQRLWTSVAQAMRLPVNQTEVHLTDPSLLSNEELVRELSRRLSRATISHSAGSGKTEAVTRVSRGGKTGRRGASGQPGAASR